MPITGARQSFVACWFDNESFRSINLDLLRFDTDVGEIYGACT